MLLEAGRDTDPFVLVPASASQVTKTLLVVGWCCWDAPLPREGDCTLAHSVRAPSIVVCRCGREYGVFANATAPGGALVLTRRV